MTSDAGLALIMQHPQVREEIEAFAACLPERRKRYIHSLPAMVTQRVYQLIAGYQDANDAKSMRHDPMMKLAVGHRAADPALASQPTICRLENLPSTRDHLRLFYTQIDAFARTYKKPPPALVLDIDPSAHLTYGDQQLTLYNHHVGDCCLMPFYVYEGQSGLPIASVIRPGKTPAAAEIQALLKRLVKRLRHHFPKTQIIFRADSHHTKPAVMDWCEAHHIDYITGLGPNVRLNELCAPAAARARELYEKNCRKGHPEKTACVYYATLYQAGTWSRPRRVICRVYHGPRGTDMRYIVTSFVEAGAQYLYQTVYCGRGEAELMIKEHKLGLGSDRSSCTSAQANQFRLALSNLAYLILHRFRSRVLKGTALARASFGRIRLELLKSGARVVVRKTFVELHLAAEHPLKELWHQLAPRCAALRQADG